MAATTRHFEYGDKELAHLRERERDPALGLVIEEIGMVERLVLPDLFEALVNQIISQQISTKGAMTIWNRLVEKLGEVTPAAIDKAPVKTIQKCGMSMRKVSYMKELSRGVLDGSIDLECLHNESDEEVCRRLVTIKGIGAWTAEMLLIFSMQRPDVFSWGDIAIHRGLRMLHRHRRITLRLFNKYRRRYSPYASVAGLYLWEIAGGRCGRLKDPAPLSDAQKKIRARASRKRARLDRERAATADAREKGQPS